MIISFKHQPALFPKSTEKATVLSQESHFENWKDIQFGENEFKTIYELQFQNYNIYEKSPSLQSLWRLYMLSFTCNPFLTLNRPGGGGIRPQAGSCLCCAETVSSRKLKLSDFYYILIGLNSEYKPVPWDIHCCHGNAIVEGCSVKFWRKSVENCIFLLKSFSNLSLGLLFVISISKLPPMPNFKQIGLKTKKLGFSTFFQPNRA